MNRAVSTLVVLAGIAGCYFAVIGRGHFAELAALRAASLAAYDRFETADEETRREPELLACLQSLEQWRTDLRDSLTLVGEATSLMIAATDQLEKDGLVVERSDALAPDGAIARPHRRIRVVVNGTLAALFSAVRNLENAALPTRVTDLSLLTGADGSSVRGEMTIECTWSEGS